MTIPRVNFEITKTDRVRRALKEGRDVDALRIAHTFRMLGSHKVTIQRGWDALQNPRFARSLGRDPKELLGAALAALKTLYPVT